MSSGAAWYSKATDKQIVSLLTEHRDLIQLELDEVNLGRHILTGKVFLGPKEREAWRISKQKRDTNDKKTEKQEAEGFVKYFLTIEKKMEDYRRAAMKQRALKSAWAEQLKQRDVKINCKQALREAREMS